MHLLDSSAIITPFHGGQLKALSVALNHHSSNDTRAWLERWLEQGFSSGHLVIAQDVYKEVVERRGSGRPERDLLRRLGESGQVKVLQPTENTIAELAKIHNFIQSRYEPHQARAFLDKHDPFLVALAKTYGAVLVTEERHVIPEGDGSSGLIRGEPRLPFVAWAFGVRWVGLLQILGRSLEEGNASRRPAL
ncbi:MAG: DUF4411 family protein [Armatimonadota bacterium]|nr:DUF4411 family protein [Armatimonadota bacterium]